MAVVLVTAAPALFIGVGKTCSTALEAWRVLSALVGPRQFGVMLRDILCCWFIEHDVSPGLRRAYHGSSAISGL